MKRSRNSGTRGANGDPCTACHEGDCSFHSVKTDELAGNPLNTKSASSDKMSNEVFPLMPSRVISRPIKRRGAISAKAARSSLISRMVRSTLTASLVLCSVAAAQVPKIHPRIICRVRLFLFSQDTEKAGALLILNENLVCAFIQDSSDEPPGAD